MHRRVPYFWPFAHPRLAERGRRPSAESGKSELQSHFLSERSERRKTLSGKSERRGGPSFEERAKRATRNWKKRAERNQQSHFRRGISLKSSNTRLFPFDPLCPTEIFHEIGAPLAFSTFFARPKGLAQKVGKFRWDKVVTATVVLALEQSCILKYESGHGL